MKPSLSRDSSELAGVVDKKQARDQLCSALSKYPLNVSELNTLIEQLQNKEPEILEPHD